MRNYNEKDIKLMFEKYSKNITHVIVAHTHYRPYIASLDYGHFKNIKTPNYIRKKLQETSKSTRHALNCFNKLLYPSHTNRAKQNPNLFKPLCFATIEGANATLDRSQTIHVNFALGNLPSVLTTQDIETLFKHAWHDKAQQSSNVMALDYYEKGEGAQWLGYSLKEAQQAKQKAWGADSIWDVSNCWIPHTALKTD